MATSAVILAFGAILLWSSNAVVGKFTLGYLAVEQIQFLQFSGAAVIFWLLARRAPKPAGQGRSSQARPWIAMALGIIGLCGTMVFQYLAFSFGPITQVNLIAYAWPLLAAFFVVALGESRRPYQLVVISALGFAGVCLLVTDGAWSDWHVLGSWGMVTAALSAICMAVFTVGAARTGIQAAPLLLPASVIGMIGTGLWCLWTGAEWNLSPALITGLYLGIGPMGIGYLLWTMAVGRDVSARVAVLGYATPVLSTAWLLASGESLSSWGLAGAGLVTLSCLLVGPMVGSVRQASKAARISAAS